MTVARRSYRPSSSRLGIVVATSGAAAVVATTALTAGPGATASAHDLSSAAGHSAPSRTYVHALTSSIRAGETARFAVGVAAEGTRPEGAVELRVGEQTVRRGLAVGTAVANVVIDEPGTVLVQGRYLGSNEADGSWSDPLEITVHPR